MVVIRKLNLETLNYNLVRTTPYPDFILEDGWEKAEINYNEQPWFTKGNYIAYVHRQLVANTLGTCTNDELYEPLKAIGLKLDEEQSDAKDLTLIADNGRELNAKWFGNGEVWIIY